MQDVVSHSEFMALVTGKTIKSFDAYTVWGRLCCSRISFTDGTCLELGVVCEEVSLDSYETLYFHVSPEVIEEDE